METRHEIVPEVNQDQKCLVVAAAEKNSPCCNPNEITEQDRAVDERTHG